MAVPVLPLVILSLYCQGEFESLMQKEPQQDYQWFIRSQPDLFFDRVVRGSDGTLWAGTFRGRPTQRNLYRFSGKEWDVVDDFPHAVRRTQVMATDPVGRLWICPMSPYEQSPYASLTLSCYENGVWKTEIIEDAGIWPQAMAMVGADEGWLVGNGLRVMHIKGTEHCVTKLEPHDWVKEALPPDLQPHLNFLDVAMHNADEGWAVGTQGLVAHYAGGAWTMLDVPEALRGVRLQAVDLTADGQVWVAGDQVIARLNKETWSVYDQLPKKTLFFDIAMRSAEDGFVVGGAGTLYRFNGHGWFLQKTNVSVGLHQVWFEEDGRGRAIGGGIFLEASPVPVPSFKERAIDSFGRYDRHVKMRVVDVNSDGLLDLVRAEQGNVHVLVNGEGQDFKRLAPVWRRRGSALVNGLLVGNFDDEDSTELMVFSDTKGVNPICAINPEAVGPARDDILRDIDEAEPELGTACYDFDGDGWLDLYIPNLQAGQASHLNHILVNDGQGQFHTAKGSGLPSRTCLPILWGDLDGDGDPDGITSDKHGRNLAVLTNQGQLQFCEQPIRANGLQGYTASYANLLLMDVDMDGDLDLVLARNKIEALLNDGHGFFSVVQTLWDYLPLHGGNQPQCLAVGDLNHDGFPELFVRSDTTNGKQNLLLSAQGDGTWLDLAEPCGLEKLEDFPIFADWDNDGDVDILASKEQEAILYENLQNDDGFLKIRLRGTPKNPQALGARIFVYRTACDGGMGGLVGYGQVGVTGEGAVVHNGDFYGLVQRSQPLVDWLQFGVPRGKKYWVKVIFPGGREVSQEAVPPGSHLLVQAYPAPVYLMMKAWLALKKSMRQLHPGIELTKWLVLVGSFLGVVLLLQGRAQRQFFVWQKRVFLIMSLLFGGVSLWLAGKGFVLHLSQVVLFSALAFGIVYAARVRDKERKKHLIGYYRLKDVIGEGGMGVIYRAYHVVTRQEVALKTFFPELMRDVAIRQQFCQEAEILKQLRHPNIVSVLESGEIDGRGFICMELLRGVTLKRALMEGGALNPSLALVIFRAVADALEHAHQNGVIHRDLKSENIFLTGLRRGSASLSICAGIQVPDDLLEDQVKLMDFGLSFADRIQGSHKSPGFGGTLAYMAPEQINQGTSGVSSDIYAFGVVMYEVLSGRIPYHIDEENTLFDGIRRGALIPLEQWAPRMPKSLARIVMKALAFDPCERFSSVAELKQALAQMKDEVPAADTLPKGRLVPRETVAGNSQVHAALTHAWRQGFQEAQTLLGKNRAGEARLVMNRCLEDLKRVALLLSEPEWDAYGHRYGIQEVMQFVSELNGGPRP